MQKQTALNMCVMWFLFIVMTILHCDDYYSINQLLPVHDYVNYSLQIWV